jgi:hypothetical protein
MYSVHRSKQHLNYMNEEMHDEDIDNRKNRLRYVKMKLSDIEIHINTDLDIKVPDNLDSEDEIWGNGANKPTVHGGGDDELEVRERPERERERGDNDKCRWG